MDSADVVSVEVETGRGRGIVVVVGVAMLTVAGILLWSLYLNSGTLMVKGEYPFTVSVDTVFGQHCKSETDCTFRLSPNSYVVLIEKPGFYDEKLTAVVTRFNESVAEVVFKVVPFLKPFEGSVEENVKAPMKEWENVVAYDWREEQAVYALPVSSGIDFFSWNGEESLPLVHFDSLNAPRVFLGAEYAVVLDDGRSFLVDVFRQRRERLFGEDDVVSGVQWDRSGTYLLLDRRNALRDVLSLWRNDVISGLEWYEQPDFVVWDAAEEGSLLVLSNRLMSALKPDEFFDPTVEESYHLYRVTLGDSSSIEVVHDFREGLTVPRRLFWHEGMLLVEGGDGAYVEIVL